jgi:hypothetical protein
MAASDGSHRTTRLRLIARVCGIFAVSAGLLGAGSAPALAARSAPRLATGSAPALAAAPGDGYVRLAHLSPDTPAVDVYLYSAGTKTPRLVLKHVGYGALSPYQRLPGGAYTVAMRPADAAASSSPVLSTTVRVRPRGAYTVAGMGPYKGIKLQVLDDTLSVPANSAALRVVVASLKQPMVDVTEAGRSFARGLRFPAATPYRTVPAAQTSTVNVIGDSGKSAAWRGTLTAGTVHTCVVLDGKSGLKVLHLRDAAQGGMPLSGVDTGLGGLAPAADDATPWPLVALATVAGLAGVAVLGALRIRRA